MNHYENEFLRAIINNNFEPIKINWQDNKNYLNSKVLNIGLSLAMIFGRDEITIYLVDIIDVNSLIYNVDQSLIHYISTFKLISNDDSEDNLICSFTYSGIDYNIKMNDINTFSSSDDKISFLLNGIINLLVNESNTNMENNFIHLASSIDLNHEIFRKIIKLTSNIDIVNKYNETPLLLALKNYNPITKHMLKNIKTLIEKGAKLDIKSLTNETPEKYLSIKKLNLPIKSKL